MRTRDGLDRSRRERIRRLAEGKRPRSGAGSNGTFAWRELSRRPGVRESWRELWLLAWRPLGVALLVVLFLLLGYLLGVEAGR